MSVFKTLNAIDVGEFTEKKLSLTYLSWPHAWRIVKEHYPDANYKVVMSEAGLPYAYDSDTGYMVYTMVTIDNITHSMWLPVMDDKCRAMKSEPYDYQTKNGRKTVEAATMFDINKTIMRCLVKNLAMFGLGLYIYAGEDLPFEQPETSLPDEDKQWGTLLDNIAEVIEDEQEAECFLKYIGLPTINDIEYLNVNEEHIELRNALLTDNNMETAIKKFFLAPAD